MKPKHALIFRAEISVPINTNTRDMISDLEELALTFFKGATIIDVPKGGHWYDEDADKAYCEDIKLFIIYFDPRQIPAYEDNLDYLAKLIMKSKEIESWIILDAMPRRQYINTK